jgi:diadenylate cyclase
MNMLVRIGFLTINWTDILDILVVTFVFYRLYLIMRGTIAIQIFLGLLVIVAGSFVATSLNLIAVSWILKALTDIWVIAFIILFQPELRRILVILRRGRLMANLIKSSVNESIEEIVEACDEMSQRQVGALIILTRTTGIRMIIESGVPLGATVSKQLLLSIFNPKAPLHDGAVVIKDSVVEAARCTLPLSSQLRVDGFIMGMRHRSAVGISEQSDVLAIVVSEESGLISVAEDGKLRRDLSADDLRQYLRQGMSATSRFPFEAIMRRGPVNETVDS